MSGDDKPRDANWIDDTILRMADSHSPEEISVALEGIISPAAVAAHTQTLLKSKNWLTAAQEDQLITLKLKRILTQLESRHMDNDNAKIQVTLLDKIGGRLDKRQKALTVDLDRLYGNQGRIMARAYDIALSYMRGALRKEIDPSRWDELAAEALLHAKTELSKHQALEE